MQLKFTQQCLILWGIGIRLMSSSAQRPDMTEDLPVQPSTEALPPTDLIEPYLGQPPNDMEVGSLCVDAQPVQSPSKGNSIILSGDYSKIYYFPICQQAHDLYTAATIYKVEGNGAMFDVSVFSDPRGDSSFVTVLEGCVDEEPLSEPPEDIPMEPGRGWFPFGPGSYNNACVTGHTWEGVRWPTTVGQMYTVIVHSYSRLSSSNEFVVRLSVVDGAGVCDESSGSLIPMDLGSVSIDTDVQEMGFTEDGVLVTDLPNCDSVPDTESKLYMVTVNNANVEVNAYVEGDNAFVTVYQGGCSQGGYRCLDKEYTNHPDMVLVHGTEYATGEAHGRDGETHLQATEERAASSEPADSVQTQYTTRPRYNYNMQSWDNEVAGTTYLLAVSTVHNNGLSTDFRLTVNATAYGDKCTDAVPVDLSAPLSQRLDALAQQSYKGLFSCHRQHEFHSGDSGSLYPGDPIGGKNVAFFSFEGTGDGVVASIIGKDHYRYYSTRMALLTADSCDAELTCATEDSYNNFLFYETKVGVMYYLAVYNMYGDSMEGAELSIESMNLSDPCDSVTVLDVSSTEVTTVKDSTDNAGFLMDTPMCDTHARLARAKVYSFTAEADGKVLTKVSNIYGDTGEDYLHGVPPFRAEMSVSQGACAGETCPDGYNLFDSSGVLGASWTVTAGETYFITVFSSDPNARGDFELTLEPQILTSFCDSNDILDFGTIPEGGLLLDGSTVSAPFYTDLYKCDEKWQFILDHHMNDIPPEEFDEMLQMYQRDFQITSRASVYTFIGDGKSYLFELSDTREFNAEVNVFAGSCNELDCQLTWNPYNSPILKTVVNEVYTIVVSDCCNSGGAGSFKLSIQGMASGDLERDASLINFESGESDLRISDKATESLFYAELPLCNNGMKSPAKVYKLESGSGSFSATVTGFGFDPQVSVVQATSVDGEYDCVGNHNWRQVFWNTLEPSVYIVVHSLEGKGDFVLHVEQVDENEGDICANVQPLDMGGVPVFGTMTGAGMPSFPDRIDFEHQFRRGGCNYPNHLYFGIYDSPTVVYSVEGTGGLIEASVFVEAGGHDVAVIVMSGTCNRLQCLPEAFSDSYSSRSLTFPSSEGETYYILVSSCCGSSSGGADFVLMVEETNVTMPNFDRGSDRVDMVNHPSLDPMDQEPEVLPPADVEPTEVTRVVSSEATNERSSEESSTNYQTNSVPDDETAAISDTESSLETESESSSTVGLTAFAGVTATLLAAICLVL